MRKGFWLLCACLCLSNLGCLENILRERPGVARTGVSAKAREVEDNLDWTKLH